MESQLSKASFGAGCFWGVEAAFRRLAGVKATQVGYMGGTLKNPTYEDVCTDRTGHAEVVEVTFDPQVISYHDLLETFWSNHNPTTLNRQGPDVGAQYRSAIFYGDDSQKKIAQAYIAQLNAAKVFPAAIVTKVDPLKGFYAAEAYHQDFLVNHPSHPYIVFNDATSGLYAASAKALPTLAKPYTTGAPEVQALLRLHEEGLRVEEVAVDMRARAGGESKLKGKKAFLLVLTVIGTLLGAKRLWGRRHA